MVLIDTSAWIEYFRDGEPGIAAEVARCLDEERVIMGDLIYCEVMQGLRSSRQRREIGHLFSTLPSFEMVGFDIADKASANYRLLRAKGLTIRKTIDVIIGTFCAANGVRLVHHDRDFTLMARHIGLDSR